MRGKGRVFQPPGKNFLMIAYYGPKPDGSTGEFRESAHSLDLDAAQAFLDRRREVANHREGLRTFEGPNAQRIKVGELLDAVKADWEAKEPRLNKGRAPILPPGIASGASMAC
jgi:hypothetical protein